VLDPACGSGHFLLGAARRLARELARQRTGEEQPSPEATRSALREVACHCLYGVDINPLAVELCRVAIWLECHQPGRPMPFLEQRIRCGNSVVGLARREELAAGIPDTAFRRQDGDDTRVLAALRARHREESRHPDQLTVALGRSAQDLETLAGKLRDWEGLPEAGINEVRAKASDWAALRSDADWLRLRGAADVVVASMYLPKTRTGAPGVPTYRDFHQAVEGLLGTEHPVQIAARECAAEQRAFHWFIEFPEVFAAGGFDAVLGNPPFLGGQFLTGAFGRRFLEWVKCAFAPARSCDLSAYFFRRSFDLLRPDGRMAMIATNTIAQGDTREGGLDVIISRGGHISFARRNLRWPGEATLQVSLVALKKGSVSRALLDGLTVPVINAYLTDENPMPPLARLHANASLSFQGSIVLGMGFMLEPDVAAGLIAHDRRNREVLFPYLNGEDLNRRPDQSPSRWVINFHDWPLERAQQYPDCYQIVEELVQPERYTNSDRRAREYWWLFLRTRSELYRTIAPLERVLVVSRVTKYYSPVVCAPGDVFSEQLVIHAIPDETSISILTTSIYAEWAWANCSTMGGSTLRYSPSDAFETFPFPHPTAEQESRMAALSEELHALRRQLLLDLQLGLTKVCNLFHAPSLADGGEVLTVEGNAVRAEYRVPTAEALTTIKRWRALQQKLDEAVAAAYGWQDVALEHGFHEQDYLPENDRVRFTVSPRARKELLRRLHRLNRERAREEGQDI